MPLPDALHRAGPEPAAASEATRQASTGTAPGLRRIRRENQECLLKAAEQIFAETGFTGATMAGIATRVGWPKANIHYDFNTKEDLYRAVLQDILRLWLAPVDRIRPDSAPAEALADHIRTKMATSRTRPHASKVLASEILHGAAQIGGLLTKDLKALVEAGAAVLDGWIAAGRMAPVDSRNFFFMVWAITQHYADSEIQVCSILDKTRLTRGDYDRSPPRSSGSSCGAWALPRRRPA